MNECDFETIGKLANENHKLLQELGVSCAELDALVNAALAAGAIGAKMSGTGRGGLAFAICKDQVRRTKTTFYLHVHLVVLHIPHMNDFIVSLGIARRSFQCIIENRTARSMLENIFQMKKIKICILLKNNGILFLIYFL